MSRLVLFVKIMAMTIISCLLGGGWALYSIKNIGDNASFMKYNGQWRVNPSMDLEDSKQRALIAKVGLFALRESEVIYYSATIDSDGLPLSSQHDYILEGTIPDARYWSYTLYGDDDFLIPNENKIYGYNKETIFFTPVNEQNPELSIVGQPTYKMLISNNSIEKNWLPSGNNEHMTVTLRLYNAAPSVYNNLETIPLPTIRRI